MIDALRCQLAGTIRGSFSREEKEAPTSIDEVPKMMRASAWRMIRGGVIERDGGVCRLCGKDLSNVPSWLTEVHHIRPKCEGGTDHPSNLVTLCVMCHRRITSEAASAESGVHRLKRWSDVLPLESIEDFR